MQQQSVSEGNPPTENSRHVEIIQQNQEIKTNNPQVQEFLNRPTEQQTMPRLYQKLTSSGTEASQFLADEPQSVNPASGVRLGQRLGDARLTQAEYERIVKGVKLSDPVDAEISRSCTDPIDPPSLDHSSKPFRHKEANYAIRISGIVKDLKANPKLDLKLKLLLVSSFEISEMLLLTHQGDDLISIISSLMDFELDSLLQQNPGQYSSKVSNSMNCILDASQSLLSLILRDFRQVQLRIEELTGKDLKSKADQRDQYRRKNIELAEVARHNKAENLGVAVLPLTEAQKIQILEQEQIEEQAAAKKDTQFLSDKIKAEKQRLVANTAQLIEAWILLKRDCSIITQQEVFSFIFEARLFDAQEFSLVCRKLAYPIASLLGDFYPRLISMPTARTLLDVLEEASSPQHLKVLSQLTTNLGKAPKTDLPDSPKLQFLTILMDQIVIHGVMQKQKVQQTNLVLLAEPDRLIKCLKITGDAYASRYSEIGEAEFGFEFLMSVSLIRILYDDHMVHNFLSYPIEAQRKVINSFYPGFIQKGTDAFLKEPKAYPIVYFMQRILQNTGKFDSKHQSHVELATSYTSLTEVTEDLTALAIFDQELLDFYNRTIKWKLFEVEAEHKSNPMTFSRLEALLSSTYKNKKEAVIYVVGLHYINQFLPGPKVVLAPDHQEARARVCAMFAAYKKTFTTETLQSNFCKFVISLCTYQTQDVWSKGIWPLMDSTECTIVLKTLAHMALSITCFPDKLGYKPLEHLDWISQDQITQATFKAPFVDNFEFENACTSMIDGLRWMFSENTRHKFGVLQCICSFMYVLGNCGVNTGFGERNCVNPSCAGILGSKRYGEDHATQTRLTPEQTLQEIRKRYQKAKHAYTRHRPVDSGILYHMLAESNDASENIRLLMWTDKVQYLRAAPLEFNRSGSEALQKQAKEDIEQYKQDFIIKHCYDHLYILATTFLMDTDQQDKFRVLCNKTLDIKDPATRYEDYFLKHLVDNFNNFAPQQYQNKRSNQFSWYKAVSCKAAESMLSDESVDPRTQLYIGRKYSDLSHASALLDTEQQSLAVNFANYGVPTQIVRLVEGTLDFDSAAAHFSPVSEYRLLIKVFPTIQYSVKRVKALIEDQLSPGTNLSAAHRFAADISYHEELYTGFSAVLGDPLMLFQHMQTVHSSKKTYFECTELTIGQLMQEDKGFLEAFERYCTTWKSHPLKCLRLKHPEIFEFGFDCHQGLDLNQFLDVSTDPKSSIINILFLSSQFATLSLLIPKGMVQSLVTKVQNKVVSEARRISGLISEQVQPQSFREHYPEQVKRVLKQKPQIWEKSIDIREASTADIFRLEFPTRLDSRMAGSSDPPKDFLSFAAQYALIVDQNGKRELQIDYGQLEQDLAQHLIKWSILNVEESQFPIFEFKSEQSGFSPQKIKEYLKLVHVIVDEKQDDHVKMKLTGKYDGSQMESLERLMGLISEICSELKQRQEYTTLLRGTEKLSLVQQLKSAGNDGLLNKLEANKELEEEMAFLDTIYLGQLPVVCKHLQSIRVASAEYYLKKHGNRVIPLEFEGPIKLAFEHFRVACAQNQECRDILQKWYDEIVTCFKEDFETDLQALEIPLYGYVADDAREEQLKTWKAHLPQETHGIVEAFYKNLDKVTFEQSYQVIQKIKEIL